MSENLPLIPEKGAICGDVRGVLRGVFRELGAPVPALQKADPIDNSSYASSEQLPTLQDTHWKYKISTEFEKLSHCEDLLRQEYAKRLSRSPLPNIYRVCRKRATSEPSDGSERSERSECGKWLRRRHLEPTVRHNANRDNSLWVRNMQCSSSEAIQVEGQSLRGSSPTPILLKIPLEDASLCSLSIGTARPPPIPLPAPSPPDAPLPDHILCIPPYLEFVNFDIGQEHIQTLRLVNLSKAELRLSVRPPSRRELRVSVGTRGQRVTAGAATVLNVSFTPRDVRNVNEDLHVRVSSGKSLVVPIRCYIQPPILDVLVPLEPSLSMTCYPEMCDLSASILADNTSGGGDSGNGQVLELGARLLGDTHCVPILLQCHAGHAAFFLITEDSWINYTLEGLTSGGAVVCGSFAWWPAFWRGGGFARGTVWCRSRTPGVHAVGLRILSSTAAVRHLWLLADSMLFYRNHITLKAHEKDYDICSETDPSCEYYVNLGTAFPGRTLTATVQLINHSPVSYAYHWTVRPWGVCSCRGDDCEGGLQRGSQDLQVELSPEEIMALGGVRVEPTRGRISPRSTSTLHVCVPDVGQQLGIQRASLMLILRDIPKESFPSGYDPMIISCQTIQSESIPGSESEPRDVCEVVCCEMEVWWEVAPVRFVLDPPLLRLPHSRGVDEVQITLRATQLFGRQPITAEWLLPPTLLPPSEAAHLTPTQSVATRFTVPLPNIPDNAKLHQMIDIFELVSVNGEWRSYSTVLRESERLALDITPTSRWLGIVAPGAHVSTDIVVKNDTFQQVDWTCSAVRWYGDISGSAWCEGREPCTVCHVRGCSCALLWPTQGTLPHTGSESIRFAVYAPKSDGCVLILLVAKRATPGDVGRSSLIAFRVLAPRLFIRALECCGAHKSGRCCECCELDVVGEKGAAVVRPRKSLTTGRKTCCRLRITNLTPVATTVKWEPPLNSEEALRCTFFPNKFDLGPYKSIQIQVLIEALRVSLRRIFVWRAQVEHTSTPLYFIIDTDVAGVEVTVELPLGGGEKPDSTVIVRRTQKEKSTPLCANTMNADMFEEFEREQVEYIKMLACRCSSPPQRSAINTPSSPVNALFPIRLPRVPLCLQYSQLPLHTVRRRTLVLRNVSVLPARWSARVRRWTRHRSNTLAADKWAHNMRDPGIAIDVHPSKGELTPGRGLRGPEGGDTVRVSVDVYADCSGLYHDQLLVQIQNVEPIILDVWVEAVGHPLMFYSAPSGGLPPPLRLSSADDQRMIRARNTTRSRLFVRAYLLREHDDEHDREKLRLYMRLEDGEPPAPTPLPSECMSISGEISDASSSYQPDPSTNVELFLSEDYGLQCLTPYTVEPETCEVAAGADVTWQVSRCDEMEFHVPTDAVLMLRCELLDKAGDNWYRPIPPPQTVQIRLARRTGRLQLSAKEVLVKICALNLPYNEVVRVRKRFRVINVGDGPLSVCAFTRSPWFMINDAEEGPKVCGAGCLTKSRVWTEELPLELLHGSSTEICVEVSIPREASMPPIVQDPPDTKKYSDKHVTVTPFEIRDEIEVHAKMNLVLEIEYPIVYVEPEAINFSFVTDADTRKTYFTVKHSSRSETLYLMAQWEGPPDFLTEPSLVCVPPGVTRRVYVQYTAAWCAAPVEGRITMTSQRAPWCCANVICRGSPIRDNKCQPTHDYTDDPVLLPPEFRRYAAN